MEIKEETKKKEIKKKEGSRDKKRENEIEEK